MRILRLGTLALVGLLVTRVAMAACGDGVVDGNETCDHGSTNGTDGCCSSACQVFDLDGDGLCDLNDGCNSSVNFGQVKESRLLVSRLSTPPGDERMRFSGIHTLPVVPAIDPAANGFCVTLFTTPASRYQEATVVTDVAIPGGPHWKAHGTRAWQYRDPAGHVGGVTRITVKLRPAIMPTTHLTNVAFLVQARRGQYTITPAMVTSSIDNGNFVGNALFAEVSLAAGTSVRTEQCGNHIYSTFNTPDTCDFDARGTSAVCHGAPPVGPCHIGDPSDLVICDVQNVAPAEDAYFRAHGTYFTGQCADLPGFEESPGVQCTVTGSATAFIAWASHPRMRYTSGCSWQSNVTPGSRNLVCS
jgi:hypothetical protein